MGRPLGLFGPEHIAAFDAREAQINQSIELVIDVYLSHRHRASRTELIVFMSNQMGQDFAKHSDDDVIGALRDMALFAIVQLAEQREQT